MSESLWSGSAVRAASVICGSRLAGERLAQVGGVAAEAIVHGDDAVVAHDAERLPRRPRYSLRVSLSCPLEFHVALDRPPAQRPAFDQVDDAR